MKPLWSPVRGFISAEPSPTFVASLLGGPLLRGSLSSFQDCCVLTAHRFPANRLAQLSALTQRGLTDHPGTSAPRPPNPLSTWALCAGGRRVGWASVLTEGLVGAASPCTTSFLALSPDSSRGLPSSPCQALPVGTPSLTLRGKWMNSPTGSLGPT